MKYTNSIMDLNREQVAAASTLILMSNPDELSKHKLIIENETDIEDTEPPSNTEHESEEKESEAKPKLTKKKKLSNKKIKKHKIPGNATYDPTKLEDNSFQVQERFKRGCECQDDQCFQGLNPEAVYRHRLNIAELTKAEHDMYLMGVIRSCLGNPYETVKHTERQRLRAQYVYQGRKICLDAFLYLENCTLYQVKRIRKHLITHGVTPRVHGNYGKVPHNTFPLDTYQIANTFLKNFIKDQELRQQTKALKGAPLHLPSDVTRKTVHDLYKEYCRNSSPNTKIMGYSTFRTFLKVQFPQLKFAKLEFVARSLQNQNNTKTEVETEGKTSTILQSAQILNENGDLVPVILTNEPTSEMHTYILTSDNKLQETVSYQLTGSNILFDKSGEPVAITKLSSI